EEGVRIKEQHGGKVTAISMGPPQAEEVLREAISAGADEAILLSDSAFAGSDTLATSYTLSRAINKIQEYDLVICGRQTIDGDTAQVGPELAEMLEIPFVAYVSKIEEIDNSHMRVQRMVEEGHEVIETPLPAVITVAKEINVPRLPSLRGLTKAKSAAIPVWGAQELGVDQRMVGLSGSATRVIKIFFPKRASNGEILQGSLESQVESLIDKLRETKLIQE
ncbi:electron transfer flavoprotein subunit beta/FixA family protein, partial [Chloroflexota bacterium]